MSNYTTDEVQAAVEKIVRSTVRHPTGILGERKIDVSFSDIQEAAAGVYILYFNAPFYTLLLGTKRLADVVATQASTIQSLIDAVLATDRLVTPISDISPLANAKAALEELEAAVSSRSHGFSDIQQVPAFRRYAQNIDSFIQQTGSNIKGTPSSASPSPSASIGGSSIVDTPSGARAKIPSLVRQLVDQQTELVRRAGLLATAMADFGSLNLPRIAAQGVISRARDVLDQRYSELSALDENTRLESLRDVTLDLLTQRPLVEKYGAAQAPGEFINTEGLATPYSDSTHLSVPAALDSIVFGPYPIVSSMQLINLEIDGGAPFNFPLPLSFIAEINGTLVEPFVIDTDRDTLSIFFGDVDDPAPPAPHNVTLTVGTRTADQICTDVNTALVGTDLVCEPYFFPTKYKSPVVITSLGGNNARFTVLGGSLTGLGIVVADEVDILEGPDLGTTWVVTAVDPGGQFIDALGSAPVTPQPLPGVDIEVGAAARALRLRDTNEAVSVLSRRTIRLVRTTEGDLAATYLGWFPGIEVRSRPVAALDVVNNIVGSTSAFSASATFDSQHFRGTARSVATDSTRVVLSLMEGTGTMTGGTSVSFSTLYFDLQDAFEAGDRLVIRSSLTPADIGLEGVIDFVAGSNFNVTFPSAVTAGDVGFEVGPSVFFSFGDVLHIVDGPNEGRYVVAEDQDVKTAATFELILESTLPVFKDGADSIPFNVEFGSELVTFKSRSEQVISKIVVNSPGSALGAQYFFSGGPYPKTATGTTPWLRFDTFPVGAVVGDLVQLYESQYNVVSREFAIVELEESNRLVKIDPTIGVLTSFSFDFDVPNPFGRIRIAQVANYSTLQTGLNAWLAQPEQQELFFRDLARFLNPILTNANPTVSMVNAATNQLKKLLAVLTRAGAAFYGQVHVPAVTVDQTLEAALASYVAPAEEPVDTLIATFRQKGADRAIDLLTEGQFSTFFKLTVDGVSYSGALMSSLRELARQDLPVRKFDRADTRGQKLIGQMPDQTDHEFTADDADSPHTPDIPAGADVASPGENF